MVLSASGSSIVAGQATNESENHGFFNSIRSNNGPSVDELIETYEDIKESKDELKQIMESYGIEIPDLSKDEKRQIRQFARELRRSGHSRQEIRDEVVDLLIGFGVDLPDLTEVQRSEIRSNIRSHLETEYGFVFIELTAEQKAFMKQTFIQLKREGNTKDEIKVELIDLYEDYGGFIPELSDAEKEDIHDWIVSMLETDYNLDLPDLSFEQREEIKDKKEEIRSLQKELRRQIRQANWLNRFRFFRYVKNDLNE